jgi:hypothetical protein
VGKAIYTIDAFPDDAQLWRIDWIGGVAYNASVPSEPLIDVCLARLPKGEANPLSARSRSPETKFVAKIGVGLLPFISTASVWQKGRPVATDCAAYRRQLTIDTKSCRTEMLGDLTANYNGIPRSYYRFGASWPHVRETLARLPTGLFSVANNLGDSVAFNLESDSFCGKNAVCREFGKTIVFSNRSLPRSYTILLSGFQDLLMLLGQTIYVLRPLQLRRLKNARFPALPIAPPTRFDCSEAIAERLTYGVFKGSYQSGYNRARQRQLRRCVRCPESKRRHLGANRYRAQLGNPRFSRPRLSACCHGRPRR